MKKRKVKSVKKASSTTDEAQRSATAALGGPASTKTKSEEEQDELNWKQANDLALREACELQISNEDSVAGSLYEVESRGHSEQLRHLFVSANRQLRVNSLYDLSNAQLLVFDDKSEIKRRSIALSREKVCHVWNTRPHGDHKGNTVVELSDEAARECRQSRANFLRIEEARRGEEVLIKFCNSDL